MAAVVIRAEVAYMRGQDLRAEVDSVRRTLREPLPEERVRVYSWEAEMRKVEKELAAQSHECELLAQRVARERQALDSPSLLSRLRRGDQGGAETVRALD